MIVLNLTQNVFDKKIMSDSIKGELNNQNKLGVLVKQAETEVQLQDPLNLI